MDLWYVTRDLGSDNNDFSFPVNLGATVNTLGDEITPFYSADENLLYFASTGHAGIENSEAAADDHLPSMVLCQTCHMDIERESYCLDCHNAGEKLAPMDHQLDWKQAHGFSRT